MWPDVQKLNKVVFCSSVTQCLVPTNLIYSKLLKPEQEQENQPQQKQDTYVGK